ncbi:unnamed protein product [Coregonus sp. 'balchen']|nr:unnamed protein product [Coregonus sp. 'balchen']
MADSENTNKQVDKQNMSFNIREKLDIVENKLKLRHQDTSESGKGTVEKRTTSEYCEKLQGWMWQYYTANVNWQSWLAVSAPPYFAPQPFTAPVWPADFPNFDAQNWYNNPFGLPLTPYPPAIPAAGIPPGETAGNGAYQRNNNHNRTAMHNDQGHFQVAMHSIVEEIDEEDTVHGGTQKVMLVALVYRILVCFYEEFVCIVGSRGRQLQGKFSLAQMVSCDSSSWFNPKPGPVVPALTSTVRALNKNFSIAFLFPAFITVFFFQHNRTVYDMVAGTIVVKRTGAR